MSVRLFVGNLPYQATDAELREHFSAVAQPSQIVMPVDRETGRPRGFAFVDFADRPSADEVIRRFDGQPFRGRPLAISEARGREERPAPRPYGGPPPPRSDAGPAAPAPRPAGRVFGPDAPPRRARPLKRHKGEQRPKGPIKERPTSRLFDVDEESADAPADFDDPATSAADMDEDDG